MQIKAFFSEALLESISGYLFNKRQYISREMFVLKCCSATKPAFVINIEETRLGYTILRKDSVKVGLGQKPLCCLLKNAKIRTYFILVFNKTKGISTNTYRIDLEYGVYTHGRMLDYWDFLRITVVHDLFRNESYGGFDSKQLSNKVVIVGSEFYKNPKGNMIPLLQEFYAYENRLFLGDSLPFWLKKGQLKKKTFLLTAAMWV